jgi:hypothetical protein
MLKLELLPTFGPAFVFLLRRHHDHGIIRAALPEPLLLTVDAGEQNNFGVVLVPPILELLDCALAGLVAGGVECLGDLTPERATALVVSRDRVKRMLQPSIDLKKN